MCDAIRYLKYKHTSLKKCKYLPPIPFPNLLKVNIFVTHRFYFDHTLWKLVNMYITSNDLEIEVCMPHPD